MRLFARMGLGLLLGSCASISDPTGAGADVLALTTALRDRDLPAIEARIDRPALKAQITGIVRAMAAKEISERTGGGAAGNVLGLMGADLANPLLENIANQALEPAVLADLARRTGLTPETVLPSRTATALGIKKLADGRVCAPDRKTNVCILFFGRYPTGWKLNAINESAMRARLSAPKPPSIVK
ncbi:DUF2939 domain-containing protein [Candidatus Phycosocius spiralis]|uniref:DUF2939 domain-containing protein n=1 Tax=Candidatus Phycosocius spiralis TaxID=2815099 RepID=A0ABQ4PVC9_9PROT|nr:DUF2939 domain-containing protein [Candidatus Phycosocius spiralis]GIU66648.1 hypothetical protein PsB1_0802 [Candidatus Phycosocius spiralis]